MAKPGLVRGGSSGGDAKTGPHAAEFGIGCEFCIGCEFLRLQGRFPGTMQTGSGLGVEELEDTLRV